jgi:hypothetical protein
LHAYISTFHYDYVAHPILELIVFSILNFNTYSTLHMVYFPIFSYDKFSPWEFGSPSVLIFFWSCHGASLLLEGYTKGSNLGSLMLVLRVISWTWANCRKNNGCSHLPHLCLQLLILCSPKLTLLQNVGAIH